MKKIIFNECKNVVGSRIRAVRSAKHISQGELAARMQTMNINLDQQLVSKIERNMRMVTDYELGCFAVALGVDEKELLKDFYKMIKDK